MERMTGKMILMVLALITQTIASPISNVNTSSTNSTIDWRNRRITCLTESCMTTAMELLSGMNPRADPCENFYEFTCGNWHHQNPLPSGYYQWNQFTVMAQNTQKQVKDILQSPINLTDITAVRKAKLSYQTCIDEEKINERRLDGIETILRTYGGWPMIKPNGTWVEGELPWQRIHNNYTAHFGVFALFSVEVTPDLFDTRRYRIMVRKPIQFRLPTAKLVSLKNNFLLLHIYSLYISNIVKAMDDFKIAKESLKDIATPIQDMIDFEIRLANITLRHDLNDSPSNLMTIDQLQALYNSANPIKSTSRINWLQTIGSIFADIPNIRIDGEEQVRVEDTQFFLKLVNLLNETPEETVVNYIHWKMVDKTVEHTTTEITQSLHLFLMVSRGVSYERPRVDWCLEQIGLKHAIGYAYVLKHYSDNTHVKAQILMQQMKIVMAKQIDKSPWLHDPTRIFANGNLDYMTTLIGYPDWYTEEEVNEYYKDLKVGEIFFLNALRRWQFELNQDRSLLRITANRKEWPVSPTKTSAFYSGQTNAVIIPASILQLPFFDPSRSEAVNYGSLGAIIGHEVTHGFHHIWHRYDEHGNIEQRWDDAVVKQYENRTQCFVDKFNKYKVYESGNETIYMDGKKTLGENIADAMGLQLAYEAYKQWARETIIDDSILSRPEAYSDDQLFFLSFANMWCSTESNEFLRIAAPGAEHSIPSLRVKGALSNMESFSRAFQCPLGSTMNPEKKCGIWS